LSSPAVPAGVRRFLLAILLLGMLGTTAELLLLAHYDAAPQLIPLALLGVAAAVLVWHGVAASAASVRALQLTMLLFVASGFVGVVLHLRSSMEFALETDPSLRGSTLFWKAARAKAPPTLAPGVMLQLGLLGLAFAHRHPALDASQRPTSNAGG
jgi:hypothetical protein